MYDFFNAAGKFIVDTYNKYAIFTLHIVIIALYGKHLFSKDVKTRYHAALKTIGEYKPKETHFGDESYTKVIKAAKEHDGIVATLYSLSALVLSILITNILVPNFYQFTLLQASCESGVDAVGDIMVLTFIQPMTITLIFGATMMIGLVLAYFKADSILTSKLRSEAGEQ